jgi:hypothetical protein
MAFKTYGELRQQLKAEGIRWTVNPAFPDDAPIKRPAWELISRRSRRPGTSAQWM